MTASCSIKFVTHMQSLGWCSTGSKYCKARICQRKAWDMAESDWCIEGCSQIFITFVIRDTNAAKVTQGLGVYRKRRKLQLLVLEESQRGCSTYRSNFRNGDDRLADKYVSDENSCIERRLSLDDVAYFSHDLLARLVQV